MPASFFRSFSHRTGDEGEVEKAVLESPKNIVQSPGSLKGGTISRPVLSSSTWALGDIPDLKAPEAIFKNIFPWEKGLGSLQSWRVGVVLSSRHTAWLLLS